MQASWEVVSSSSSLDGILEPAETGVYVGIQQMEYGNLVAARLESAGPFSGWSSDA